MFSVPQVLEAHGHSSCLLREKARNVFLPSFLVCFLFSPSIPPVTMISLFREDNWSFLAAVWVTRNPHSPTLCSTSSARKIMLGYCWTSHCPFCRYRLLLLSFPCSVTSFVVQSIHFCAQISGSPSCIGYMLCRGTLCCCLWMSD